MPLPEEGALSASQVATEFGVSSADIEFRNLGTFVGITSGQEVTLPDNFYDNRVAKVKMINSRSKLNQFAFHVSNPIIMFFRNIGLKILTKNKTFLENYLGKIYKS